MDAEKQGGAILQSLKLLQNDVTLLLLANQSSKSASIKAVSGALWAGYEILGLLNVLGWMRFTQFVDALFDE